MLNFTKKPGAIYFLAYTKKISMKHLLDISEKCKSHE